MPPDPPNCLAEAGRTLWQSVVSANDLTDAAGELLLLACKQNDRAAEARRLLADSTIVTADRFGQEKPHPAVAIERAASLACARLLAEFIGVAEGDTDEAELEDDFYQ